MDCQVLYIMPEKKEKKKKERKQPSIKQPSIGQNSVDTQAHDIMPVWLKSFLNVGTHPGWNSLCCCFLKPTLLIQQPYWCTLVLPFWPQHPSSLSLAVSWQWIFVAASIPCCALLLREQFEPRDAQTKVNSWLIAPLVEKCHLNMWLLMMRSELIVSKTSQDIFLALLNSFKAFQVICKGTNESFSEMVG